MSRHYRDSKDIPNDVLAARLKELSDYCTKNDMPSEFSMRIPCELDRDADVVLGEASRRLASLALPVTDGVWGILTAALEESADATDRDTGRGDLWFACCGANIEVNEVAVKPVVHKDDCWVIRARVALATRGSAPQTSEEK